MSSLAFCTMKSRPALSSKVTIPQTDEAVSGSLENLLAVIGSLHSLTLLWSMRVVAEKNIDEAVGCWRGELPPLQAPLSLSIES